MKKLSRKNLEELAKAMPPLSEIEQRTIIGGDGRHRNDPFSSAGHRNVFDGYNTGSRQKEDGLIAMYNGTHWVSIFKQNEKFYCPDYKKDKTPYTILKYKND